MTIIRQLLQAGQSVWLDYIHKGMLDSGELVTTIAEDGLTGITSNPSIFEKSITSGNDYDASIARVLAENPAIAVEELFNHLAVDDIRRAADAFRTVYDESDALNGYVSIEVSPDLAFDTEGTLAEARRLFEWINRPNVMIKVPGTRAGLPAFTQLISEGIPVNVTLLFSVERYREVVDAHLAGLARRRAQGLSVKRIASVASFFVSRVDSAIDTQLEALGEKELMGKAAIANAKLAYAHYLAVYHGGRFHDLEQAGAQPQRLLWASTSTKNPDYPDTLYVDELIGPNTVNTIPPATYSAFKDHGTVAQTLATEIEEAPALIARLEALGISLKTVTETLEKEGVDAFVDSFKNLLDALKAKM